MLQQLSQMLNSNENFENNDSFKLSFTNVRGVSRGNGQRNRKPGDSHPETFKRIKRSIVMIDDNDNLCCALAIVTAKAKVDGNPNWEGFKKGRTIQNHQGILLHIEANVPQGLCGYDELQKFSMAPSLYDY
jgi:hypothetical protein